MGEKKVFLEGAQGQNSQIFLSLWGHLVPSKIQKPCSHINTHYTHTNTLQFPARSKHTLPDSLGKLWVQSKSVRHVKQVAQTDTCTYKGNKLLRQWFVQGVNVVEMEKDTSVTQTHCGSIFSALRTEHNLSLSISAALSELISALLTVITLIKHYSKPHLIMFTSLN